MANERVPIFALSADPVTRGHIHLVEKALRVFERVKVVVTSNTQKKYDFSQYERVALCRKTFAPWPAVEVDSSDGLLADYAFRNGHRIFLRGIRTATDLEFENVLESGHRSQVRGIQTIYLSPEPEFRHISSSLAKVLLREMGDLRAYVPLFVKENLEKKILGQYRICVTGPIASGKSYVISKLCAKLNAMGYPAEEIDMDLITGEVYHSELGGYKDDFRRKLGEAFGKEVLQADGTIDKNVLRNKVFGDESRQALSILGEIIRQPLETELRRKLLGKKGILFLAAAVGGERDWIWHTNNHVMMIHAPSDVQETRLREREKCDAAEAKKRIHFSGTAAEKRAAVRAIQVRDGQGNLIEYENAGDLGPKDLDHLASSVINLFPELKR